MTNLQISTIENEFKEKLKKIITSSSFYTWIRPVKILVIEEHIITLQVPSRVHLDFIKGQYLKPIKDSLYTILHDPDIHIKFLIDSDTDIMLNDQPTVKPKPQEKKIINLDEKKEVINNDNLHKYAATNLNPKFTFENFVQGSGNETAYASAVAVSAHPRNSPYNPLLIFGGVGLGKTHLIQSVGNYAFNNGLAKNIFYTPSDQFVQDIVNNIKNKTIDQYKQKLKEMDMIIIDDIQFFARKEKSMEELFHIFNYIYMNNGLIILTSDFHPNDIHNLDDRLKSRFSMGLITDVRPPDLETRAAIIKFKAEELGFELDEEVVMFIANNINTNVRELEGAVKKIHFHQHFMKKNDIVNIAKAKDILKEFIVLKKATLNIDKIQDIVSSYYNISKDLLLKKTRTKEIAEARAIAMYLCTTQLTATTKSIGANFGNREHSTVSHASKKIQDLLNKKDPKTTQTIEELLNLINLASY